MDQAVHLSFGDPLRRFRRPAPAPGAGFARSLARLALLLGLVLASRGADAPEPRTVDPGPPPSDAIVLFDGRDLSAWRAESGGEARWKVEDGAAVVNGSGSIVTKQEFGDCQLHLEWAAPAKVEGEGQGRGNSGVYFQGRYEIQVLDSHQNPTYADGQAGAFYGHRAPLVNAARQPGRWQVFDIIFRAPKTGPDGRIQPGSFTVLHNGVLIQDHVPIPGEATTAALFKGPTPRGPLVLQDHGNPVRYRNIWLRPL